MKSSCVLLASCLAVAYATDMFQITVFTGQDESVGVLAGLDELIGTHRTSPHGQIGNGVSDG
jgi:hypothetical protein